MRRRAALGIAAALALATLLAPLAAAHAVLVSSDPASGARLDKPPAQVKVVLSEPVATASVRVVDASDKQVDLGDSKVQAGDHPVVTASLPATLPPGAYRILWKAVAQDTHATSGTIGFSVGAFEPPQSGGSSPDAFRWTMAVARGLSYLGLALALGAAVFLAWMPAAGAQLPRQPLVLCLATGAVAQFAGAAWLLQDYCASLQEPLGTVVHTKAGALMAWRTLLSLAAFAIAGLALLPRARNRTAVPMASLLVLASGLVSPLLGHANIHGVGGMAVDMLHLVASALWVGSLAIFLALLAGGEGRLEAGDVRALGRRFGTLALACVLVLFTAGLLDAVYIAGWGNLLHPLRLLGSAWGKFLATKIALAGVMLVLAAVNRYNFLEEPADGGLAGAVQKPLRRLGPAFHPLAEGRGHGFRRTLGTEATIGAIILVLAGFLASTSPPQVAAAAAAQGLQLHGDGDAYRYLLVITPPPVAGATSDLRLYIESADTHQAVTDNTCGRDTCVQVDLGDPAHPEAGAETHTLAPDGDGGWVAHGVLWTHAGNATATARAQTAEVFQDNATMEFTIAAEAK